MNKIYKSKWNNSSQQWVAVSELASGKSKNRSLCKAILSSALVTVGITTGSVAFAAVINNSTDISTAAVGDYPISDVVTDGTATIITNTGDLSTAGSNTSDIYVNNSTGDITIVNSGELFTTGNSANAIHANTGTGNIEFTNKGNIHTAGNGASGMKIFHTNAGGSIKVTHEAGATINTDGTGSRTDGIHVYKDANSVADAVAYIDGDIFTKGAERSAGVYLSSAGTGDLTIYASGNVTADASLNNGVNAYSIGIGAALESGGVGVGNTRVEYKTGTVTTNGDLAFGLYAATYGDINGTGSATVINRGGTVNTTGNSSNAIFANVGNLTGNANVFNTGKVSTQGTNSHALAGTSVGGDISIQNFEELNTAGAGSYGIYAKSSGNGNIEIINTGNITTNGDYAYGLYGYSVGSGNVNITSNGNIKINAASHTDTVKGIAALADGGGDANVIATGNISVLGQSTSGSPNAIEARSKLGSTSVTYGNGTAEGYSGGIVLWDLNSGNSISGTITLANNAIVKSTVGYALSSSMNQSNQITTSSSARIEGSKGIRIVSGATASNTINHAGNLNVESDLALSDNSVAGAKTTLTNSGNISGYLRADLGSQINVNNESGGLWNIRDFSDSTGDGIRDTKTVAISTFGGGQFTNKAGGVVSLAPVTGETTVNDLLEYRPSGSMSINNAGTVQGQLLNLNSFENSGLIDMTANNQAGDVLVITGSGAAGTNGGGTFLSNGGSLKIDTLLNQGGSASLTDVLVLDNVHVGANGATKVYISPTANNTGKYTPGDGIKIIETQGTQDDGAFALGNAVLSGAYEYKLFGTDLAGNANGFYLRSQRNNLPLYNPNIGSYIGNQYATSTMFNQNILDRRESVRNTDKNIWMRTSYSETRYDQLHDLQHTKTDNTILQAGIDALRYEDFTAGAYMGYGRSRTQNHSKQTGTGSNVRADGYQVGIYGTWMPDANQGPYVDVWGHYAWYKNRIEGEAQQYSHVKYNSHGYALSVEAGYGFNLVTTDSGRTWIIQPHAQVIYNNLETKGFTDNNYTDFAKKNASGFNTRIGARFYGEEPAGTQGVLPFVEANWLYNGIKTTASLDNSNFKEKIGQNVGELKLGLNGHINDKVSVFGHVGGQLGNHDYKRGEVQLGLNVNW